MRRGDRPLPPFRLKRSGEAGPADPGARGFAAGPG
jgi:hypothetical protein